MPQKKLAMMFRPANVTACAAPPSSPPRLALARKLPLITTSRMNRTASTPIFRITLPGLASRAGRSMR